jgi:hypothetical protein
MKIYFGVSIAGGRKYLETYQKIVSNLKSTGHQVLTKHVVQPDVLELEKNLPRNKSIPAISSGLTNVIA